MSRCVSWPPVCRGQGRKGAGLGSVADVCSPCTTPKAGKGSLGKWVQRVSVGCAHTALQSLRRVRPAHPFGPEREQLPFRHSPLTCGILFGCEMLTTLSLQTSNSTCSGCCHFCACVHWQTFSDPTLEMPSQTPAHTPEPPKTVMPSIGDVLKHVFQRLGSWALSQHVQHWLGWSTTRSALVGLVHNTFSVGWARPQHVQRWLGSSATRSALNVCLRPCVTITSLSSILSPSRRSGSPVARTSRRPW